MIASLAFAAVMTLGAPAPATACTHAQHVNVPCAGLLVPTEQARDAIACRRVDLPSCRAKGAKDRALCELTKAELKRLRQIVRTPKARPWYESPWFGGAVGVVVGVAASVAVVAAVRR